MTLAHDLYAETNPAFCAVVLLSFVKAYVSMNRAGPELPIAYLALPVALSGDLGHSFVGTNRRTGLMEWAERNPALQIGLADRVNHTLVIVTDAVRFACFTRVLVLGSDARLLLGDRKSTKKSSPNMGVDLAAIVMRAERLGYWFAMSGSSRTVFSTLGLTV